MTKDPRVYLAHILERAIRIEEYLREGEAVFTRDPKTQDAVIRNFEVIGEAAKRVPAQTIRFTKYEVTSRGGKRRALLQRGQFTRIVPQESSAPAVFGEPSA